MVVHMNKQLAAFLRQFHDDIPFTGDKDIRLMDVKNGAHSMEAFIAQLTDVDQLLRRMTGSITEYINETGHQPLQISDYVWRC